MATMLLSAAGAAVGGMVGGSVAGLSSVAIGRFIGGIVGNAIDQRIMGAGAGSVEQGRIDRYRITGTGEGRAIADLYGKMRVGGHVIWATRFQEHVTTSGGGKGAPSGPTVNAYRYSVSLAIALCEGEITGVTRLWADGDEIALQDLSLRIYTGGPQQLPDPKIEAVEGINNAPAYRGLAYVVFEDLDLEPFGNRVPQFSFEVSRPSPCTQDGASDEPSYGTQAVALIPGSGEYALATEPVYYQDDVATQRAANVNAPSGGTDFVTALRNLDQELPNCSAVSLVVSWFGSDLRCANCEIRPKVESASVTVSMPWVVAGADRSTAQVVPSVAGRPIYGGTPTDASVIQAIAHLNEQGKAVMYYPFILMDQLANNALPDPWSDALDQPALPWRGRVTLSKAPGQSGSPDGTSLAETEVAAFFGSASASDFSVEAGVVNYTGPDEWRYRRFILHQAALCVAAGGVESFCIGSEMRSLTWVRGASGQFAAVLALIDLAAEVRSLLGPDVKISYAADWSEYFGYQPQDGSGDLYYHLDALWADANIDFVGIDNYMPLSDWRDGNQHADAHWGSIYNLEYLQANIEGGEGYDWYYHSPEAEAAQRRTAITDGAYNEPWVWRYKDLRNWWSRAHHDRVNGVRQASASAWVPTSKPIRFCEIGCAAVDKGTNQPNKFLDPKSSESSLPKYSNGQLDEYIQHQYLTALYRYWGDAARNPLSALYGGRMIDMSKAFVWAWDTRPWPWFPNATKLWSDSENYPRGHWISGRSTHRSLASVVHEICARVGVEADVSDLRGLLRGYGQNEVAEPRKALQPLMVQFGFDAIEREGSLIFRMRGKASDITLDPDHLAVGADLPLGIEKDRAAHAETLGRVRLNFVESGADYQVVSEEAILADEATHAVTGTEAPLILLRGEGQVTVARWLSEARLARDSIRFSLPLSNVTLGAGDIVALDTTEPVQYYRIDRADLGEALQYQAIAVDPSLYDPAPIDPSVSRLEAFSAPVPVKPLFMDLPLMRGDEVEHAPFVSAVARPWPGTIAVYKALEDNDYALNATIASPPRFGVLETPLVQGRPGVIDRGGDVQVRMISGSLESISMSRLLAGGNVALIGDGSPDNWEVMQFQTAELTAPNSFAIRNRLRGQRGSGALVTQDWPVGSWFVMLDGTLDQLDLTRAERGIAHHYRIGPARKPVSDSAYVQEIHAFSGNGLRPYAPVHLRAQEATSGDVVLSWIRQTRIDGEYWGQNEVPLGEESELYHLRVVAGGTTLRSLNTSDPAWTYTQAAQSEDNANGVISFHVSQISARYGPGPETQVSLGL